MKTVGMNAASVRENNRALILQLICTNKCITRNELSARSRLSLMTVTNIANELVSSGIVEDIAAQQHIKNLGRTPMLLQLSPASPVIGGIFLSKDCLSGIIGDMSLNVLVRESIQFDPVETKDSIMKKMRDLASSLVSKTQRKVIAFGVAAVGVIDGETGILRYVTDFFDIQQLKIREQLSAYLDLPVFVYADMQAAGLSELYFGVGQKKRSFMYVGLCNGIGAATVLNHELMSTCGEIGHMCIDWAGPRCTCGNCGCLELYASTPSILHRIAEECGMRLNTLEAAVEYSQKNSTAYCILYSAVQKLCFAINNYINLINVPIVILGHDGYCIPDELLAYMENHISHINVGLHQNSDQLCFLKSTFGKEAPLYGTICIVLEQLFRCRFPLEALIDNGAKQESENN